MADREIKIPITGDSSNYKKALKEAEGATSDFAGGVGKFAAAVGGVFAAEKLGEFALDAIGAASDFNEEVSKSKVIFGDADAAVVDFATSAAQNLGLSKQAALEANDTFAVFGGAADLSGQQLVDFSGDLTTLAADMGSFSNTSPEQAIEAIGSALRGESEPIRAYGVLLNDASVKARAMEMGIYDGNGALTQQQRVLATQAEILAQTTQAQGDFGRTSDGLAGQLKILNAEYENAKVALGENLLPIVEKAVIAFSDLAFGGGVGEDVFSNLHDAVSRDDAFAITDITRAFGGLVEATGNARGGFDKLKHGAGDFFAALAGSDTGEPIRNLEKAFGDLAKHSPEDAYAVTHALTEVLDAADAGDEGSKQWAASMGLTRDELNKLRGELPPLTTLIDGQEGATADLSATMDDATIKAAGLGAIEAVVKGSTEALKDATEDAKRKSDAFADSIKNQQDKLKDLYSTERSAVDAKFAFRDATDEAKTKVDEMNDTLAHHKETSDESTGAIKAAKDAALDASEKFATMNGAAIDSEGGIRRQIESLVAQRDTLAPGSPLRKFLQEYIDALNAIPSNISTIMDLHISQGSVTTAAGDVIGSRGGPKAAGGPVSAGVTYPVGEKGPEMFTPSTNGTIIPNDALGGGGVTNNYITLHPVGMTEDDLVRLVKKYERRNGPGWRSGAGGISGGTP